MHSSEDAQARIRAPGNSLSIPFVLAAALLMGLGIFALTIWLVTFNWAWFAGVLPATVGALMMFDRRAGSESAS